MKMVLLPCLALVMLSSAAAVAGQPLWPLENAEIEVTLEVDGGSCDISIFSTSPLDQRAPLLEGWVVENVDISVLEITSAPGQAGLSMILSGSMFFDMSGTSQFAIHWLDYLVFTFQEDPEKADQLMMWLVENNNINQLLSPFAEIENIHVNSITWDQSVLSGSFSLTLTGSGFDDQALVEELARVPYIGGEIARSIKRQAERGAELAVTV